MRTLLAGLVAGAALMGCDRGAQSVSRGADGPGGPTPRESAPCPGVSATFLPDGNRLLVIFHAGLQERFRTLSATLWDVPTGKFVRRIDDLDRSIIIDLVFLPDGRRALTAGEGLRLWDVATGATIRTFAESKQGVSCIAITPDGTKVLTGGNHLGDLRLWDLATGTLIRDYNPNLGDLLSIAISPDGKAALIQRYNVSPDDSNHKLLDLDSGRWLWSLTQRDGYDPTPVAFSPDGKLVAADRRGVAPADREEARRRNARMIQHVLIDAASGKVVRAFARRYYDHPLDLGYLVALGFSPDGRRLQTADADGKLRVYDVAAGREVRSASVGLHRVLALSPDGTRVLTTNDGRDELCLPRLDIRDTADGRPLKTLNLSGAWATAGLHGKPMAVPADPLPERAQP